MITLQLSSTHGLISWFIRKFTWSDFSHVDVVLPDGKLLGAQWDGVKVREPNYQKFSKTARFTASLPAAQEALIMDFITAQVGKKYDKSAIFGILFRRGNWQEDDSWFCSELVAAAFASAGIPLIRENKSRITPRDIAVSPVLTPIDAVAKALRAVA